MKILEVNVKLPLIPKINFYVGTDTSEHPLVIIFDLGDLG